MSERDKIMQAIEVSDWLDSEGTLREKAEGLIITLKAIGFAIVPVEPAEENASTRLYRDMKQIRCFGCGRETVLAKDLPDLCQSCLGGP